METEIPLAPIQAHWDTCCDLVAMPAIGGSGTCARLWPLQPRVRSTEGRGLGERSRRGLGTVESLETIVTSPESIFCQRGERATASLVTAGPCAGEQLIVYWEEWRRGRFMGPVTVRQTGWYQPIFQSLCEQKKMEQKLMFYFRQPLTAGREERMWTQFVSSLPSGPSALGPQAPPVSQGGECLTLPGPV